MGQLTNKKILGSVEDLCAHLEIEAGPEAVEKLALYAAELSRWNSKINLSGAKTPEAFVEGPLFDALTLVTVLERTGSLVDVGSGGGLPGIPAAVLAREVEVTLVEPRSRRASFLRHAVDCLGLESTVIEDRLEKLGDHGWHAAVAQAVWSPLEWLRLGARLVEPGGAIYVLGSGPIATLDLDPRAVLEIELGHARPADGSIRHSARFRV